MIPFTRRHVLCLEKAGKFPRRIQIGARRVWWLLSEIEASVAQCAERRAVLPKAESVGAELPGRRLGFRVDGLRLCGCDRANRRAEPWQHPRQHVVPAHVVVPKCRPGMNEGQPQDGLSERFVQPF